MATADRCLESLAVIELLWPSLLAARQPGSSLGSSNSPPGIEQARSLREERAEIGSAGGTIKAFSAPCDLAVVMAIDSIELALAVAHNQLKTIQKLPRLCSRCQHPIENHERGGHCGGKNGCTGRVRCGSFRLKRIPPGALSWHELLVDAHAAESVEFRLAVARREIETTLSLIENGTLITALCPWCQGVNEAMPGGSFTLRAFTPGSAPETYVMCFNPICDPPQEACGYRSEGRPFWSYNELDWLAKQLNVIDFKRRRRIKATPEVVIENSG